MKLQVYSYAQIRHTDSLNIQVVTHPSISNRRSGWLNRCNRYLYVSYQDYRATQKLIDLGTINMYKNKLF